MLSVNIIGAGKLGISLGYFIAKNKIASIKNICNKNLNTAIIAKEFIGQGMAVAGLELLEDADIFIITTPDDQIALTCENLIKYKKLKKNNIIIHCSGALSSSILLPAKQQGCLIASMHPAASFMKPITDLTFYKNIYITLDGDLLLVNYITNILDKFKLKYIIINDNKALYHVSTVIASNFIVALFFEAQRLLQSLIIDKKNQDKARGLLLSLLSTVVNNLQNNSTKSALTGPIARGDCATIKSHLDSLLVLTNTEQKNTLMNIYKSLSWSALQLSPASNEIKNHLYKILQEVSWA